MEIKEEIKLFKNVLKVVSPIKNKRKGKVNLPDVNLMGFNNQNLGMQRLKEYVKKYGTEDLLK